MKVGRPKFQLEDRPGPRSKFTAEQRKEQKLALQLNWENPEVGKRSWKKKDYSSQVVERRVTRGTAIENDAPQGNSH